MANKSVLLPLSLHKRIMRRWADGERPLVLAGRGDKPTKVYGYGEYAKMMRHPNQHKPWKSRKQRQVPDPLGAADSKVMGKISRDQIYE